MAFGFATPFWNIFNISPIFNIVLSTTIFFQKIQYYKMPPKKDTKTKIDDEKYLPAVKVDVTKPLNKGSMSWTDESTTFTWLANL